MKAFNTKVGESYFLRVRVRNDQNGEKTPVETNRNSSMQCALAA